MNNSHIANGKTFFTAILLIVAVVLGLLVPRAAVNVDEQLHYPHAKKVVNWYFTGGKDKSSLHTPQTNLKYYGQSVDNLTALINRIFHVEDEFLIRHITGAIFFLLLLFFTGILSHEVTGSWLAAVFTVMALCFMPRLAGQAFGNLKDIPFAAGYVAGLLMIIRCLKEFPSIRWKSILLLGMAIAFTVSVRAGGFILFAYLGFAFLLYFILKPFYLLQIISTKPVFVKLLGQFFVVLIIGYFAGLLFWPYALQNILVHPYESLRVMEHYKVSIRQIFEGTMIWSTDLPWYYLPKWLLISTPLIMLIGFAVYLFCYVREFIFRLQVNRQMLVEGFVFFAFAFPFIYVIVIGSNLYSGIRQMLFILPPFAILSVWGLIKVLALIKRSHPVAFYLITGIFLIMLIWPLKHQVTTFPADYVYFNSLAGGNKKAWSRYEYDYYFHSVKQAVNYLDETVGPQEVIVAMNSNLSNYFDKKENIDYQYTRFLERSSYDWDYGIFGLNYLDSNFLQKGFWKDGDVVKTFYHKGNPVVIVVKRSDKYDFYGISEIKNGNLHLGIEFLEKVLLRHGNNVWIYVNLAKAYLKLGDRESFKLYLEQGKRIHPGYEPLLLLEVDFLVDEEEYEKANQVLDRLLEVNPRYLPAKGMIDKVKSRVELKNKK